MDNSAAAPAEPMPPLGEILSAGTSVTVQNVGPLLGLWLAVGLPPQILGFIAVTTTGLKDKESITAAVESGDFRSLGILAVIALIGVVFGLIGYAATLSFSSKSLRGQPLSVGDLIADGAGHAFAIAVVSIIVGLCVGFGVLLLILPGLYLLVRLSLAVCATAGENLGPFDAAGRSWELVGENFGSTILFILALFGVGLCAALGLAIVGFVLRLVTSVAGAAGAAVAGLGVNTLQFLISAWGTSCMMKYYLELAARKPRAV